MLFKMNIVGNICKALAVDLNRPPGFRKLSLAGDGVRILRCCLTGKKRKNFASNRNSTSH